MKVYKVHYTHDNRVKAVYETDGPEDNSNAWWVIVGGLVALIVWLILW